MALDPSDATDAAAAAAAASKARQPTGKSSTKRSRTTEPAIEDFYILGRDIQNRSGHRVGAELSEEDRYKEFFGCRAEIALIVWSLLTKHCLLPDAAKLNHFLWALFFMKIYPREKVACALAGASGGAIDPKTLRKYVWPMIRSIADLEQYLVCTFKCCIRFVFVVLILTPV